MAGVPEEKENSTPLWVYELENRLQSRKQKLGHEIGAGSKCFQCKENCPGLELHFWRKKCKNCKCSKEDHDIAEDDNVRFQILFSNKGNSANYLAAKSVLEVKVKNKILKNSVQQQPSDNEDVTKAMKFDWVPPEVPPSIAAEYMNELPCEKVPISGSAGAKYRKIQMKKQIPLHDIMPENKEHFTPEEYNEFNVYLQKLRDNAGIGKILRVKQLQLLEHSEPYNTQEAQASESIKADRPGEVQEMNSDFRNMNINSPRYEPPAGTRPLPNAFPQRSKLDLTPRTALRTLPSTIPRSILRLPSTFNSAPNRFRPLPVESNINDLTFDKYVHSLNNTGGLFGDNEESDDSFNMSGIVPLAQTPPNVGENGSEINTENELTSFPSNACGVSSTPIQCLDFPEPTVTQSKNAQKVNKQDYSLPLSAFAVFNNQKIVPSDFENGNNEEDSDSEVVEASTLFQYPGHVLECNNCKGAIDSIAVFVVKAGLDVAWHPKCFVCKECEELLVDLMYFYHKGHIYCARHYTDKLKIHRCFSCDELIFHKEYTLAEGEYYHPHHFCCIECDVELGGKQYVLNDLNESLPTCLKCFENIYAKVCDTCNQRIKANEQGICYKCLAWHATSDCFHCMFKGCGKSLVNQRFIVVNSTAFCSRVCSGLSEQEA